MPAAKTKQPIPFFVTSSVALVPFVFAFPPAHPRAS